ncbi:MAG: DUF4389 domain-containing protein [Chloroflexi bacterium]|nr:DUF4389 domain-containing protein [Chloroflexota bacterium]
MAAVDNVAVESPLEFRIDYPESLSRLHLLAKIFLGQWYVGFPHGIALSVYGFLTFFAFIGSFIAILATGKYPEQLFQFNAGFIRWLTRVQIYLGYLTDDYPPFNTRLGDNALYFDVQNPGSISRGNASIRFFFGWLYAGIPHGVALLVYGIAVGFVGIYGALSILFTGTYPEGAFNFVVGWYRWATRLACYLLLLNDEYPPFNGQP